MGDDIIFTILATGVSHRSGCSVPGPADRCEYVEDDWDASEASLCPVCLPAGAAEFESIDQRPVFTVEGRLIRVSTTDELVYIDGTRLDHANARTLRATLDSFLRDRS